jgi:hypothetical protein
MSASIFRSQSGTSPHSEAQNRPLLAVIVLGAVLIGQLLTISLLYTHAFEFTCRYNAPAFFCQFLSQSVIRVICIAGVLALFAVARPVVLGKVWTSQRAQAHRGWMLAQGAGFVMWWSAGRLWCLVHPLPATRLARRARNGRIWPAHHAWPCCPGT